MVCIIRQLCNSIIILEQICLAPYGANMWPWMKNNEYNCMNDCDCFQAYMLQHLRCKRYIRRPPVRKAVFQTVVSCVFKKTVDYVYIFNVWKQIQSIELCWEKLGSIRFSSIHCYPTSLMATWTMFKTQNLLPFLLFFRFFVQSISSSCANSRKWCSITPYSHRSEGVCNTAHMVLMKVISSWSVQSQQTELQSKFTPWRSSEIFSITHEPNKGRLMESRFIWIDILMCIYIYIYMRKFMASWPSTPQNWSKKLKFLNSSSTVWGEQGPPPPANEHPAVKKWVV